MALTKYTISVVKENPLLKIKVTGIYNERDQNFYYHNPLTGAWERMQDGGGKESPAANQGLSVEFLKKMTYCLKNLADRFYEESKDLFGSPICRVSRYPQSSRLTLFTADATSQLSEAQLPIIRQRAPDALG